MRRRGFTMIELLVVVALVGFLIGLLIPALHSSVISARRSKCLNNLRQMGAALRSYCDTANRGYLPVAPGYDPHEQNTDYVEFFPIIRPYLDSGWPDRGGGPEYPAVEPYSCPADHELRPKYGFSYSYMAGLYMAPVWNSGSPDPREAHPVTLDLEAFPTYGWLIVDALDVHPGNPYMERGINATYMDGHTDWAQPDPAYKNITP
ncbi:MAG: type II secretion system protein [Phycisphaerales bacterium]|nr:type II secretion system protein [Phycisphaerales bacterium]